MKKLLFLFVFLSVSATCWADVHFVEEIVNPGFGPRRIGARKTVNEVYIKGSRQKIKTRIEADEKTAQDLKKQGHPLRSSTILRLDENEVYEIDLEAGTFLRQNLPPAGKKVASPTKAKKGSGRPKIKFSVEETGDTARIAGILCKRIVARMQARYYDPKTRRPRRENRYVYDAWIARDFPGYGEIERFQRLQRSKTSYPSLIGGGLDQLENAVEDAGQLAAQLDALKGFVMRSTLRAFVVRPGKKKPTQVFRLDRTVKSLTYSPLPDSLFIPPRGLTRIKTK